MTFRLRGRALASAPFALVMAVVVAGCGESGKSNSVNPPIITIKRPKSTRVYTLPSSSMEPTLHCAKPALGCEGSVKDRLVVESPPGDLTRGEIVVFRTPPLTKIKCGAGGTFVKRIIGLPGEKVELRLMQGNGYVFINGKKISEPYIQAIRRSPASQFGPTTVAMRNYFVMGDNRAQSCDSRFWGTVPSANIIGKVTRIIRTG